MSQTRTGALSRALTVPLMLALPMTVGAEDGIGVERKSHPAVLGVLRCDRGKGRRGRIPQRSCVLLHFGSPERGVESE